MNSYLMRVKKSSKMFLLILLAVVVFFILRSVLTMGGKYLQAKRVHSLYSGELEELEKQEKYLSDQLESLVSEDGIDYFIRDHYRVAKPGERLIIIVDEKNESSL